MSNTCHLASAFVHRADSTHLYLDAKGQHNQQTRKLAYAEAFQLGMCNQLRPSDGFHPEAMGLNITDRRDQVFRGADPAFVLKWPRPASAESATVR